jgi:hypothetical protein
MNISLLGLGKMGAPMESQQWFGQDGDLAFLHERKAGLPGGPGDYVPTGHYGLRA